MRGKPKIIGSIAGRLRCASAPATLASAVEMGLVLAKEGADILDITPPCVSQRFSEKQVSATQEALYVTRLIKELRKKQVVLPLALQTVHPQEAQDAIAAGLTFLCDKTGMGDEAMYEAARGAGCAICISYKPGVRDSENDVFIQGTTSGAVFVEKLVSWFEMQAKTLLHAGIEEDKIIIDVVLEDAKNVDDNILIISNLNKFQALGFQVLIDLSLSNFLEQLFHRKAKELLAAEIAVDVLLQLSNVDYIRVNDVKAHYDALHVVRSLHKVD